MIKFWRDYWHETVLLKIIEKKAKEKDIDEADVNALLDGKIVSLEIAGLLAKYTIVNLPNSWYDYVEEIRTTFKCADDEIKDYFEERIKKEIFACMIKTYKNHKPDGKDIMRGETCKSDKAAVAQLKRIEDTDKFWRRLKSLLQHKFKVTSLIGTAYEHINTDIAEKWLTKASDIYQNKMNEDMDVLDMKVEKLAKILGL